MLKKIKNSKNKVLICIISIIIIILIIAIIANLRKKHNEQILYEQEKQRISKYTDITDFKSAEEVAIYLDTKLLSIEQSDIENVDYILKMELKYNLEQNVQNYFEKLIHYMAYVLDYKSFYIIDEEKNINILIACNSENKTVVKYYINDIESYFEKMQSNENIENYSETTTIQATTNSEILKQLMENNWKTENVNLGTLESTYRNYNVYFDEGYEIRKVNGKVFNIVFNKTYENEIIENIKVSTDTQTIINKLGTPQFKSGTLIGYKTEKFYIFFTSEQVSIYPVINYNTEKIVQIIEKYENTNDIVNYLNEIKEEWQDYDIYDYDKNYVILQYTLKGICFKYDSTAQKGIVLYNNYIGNIRSNISIQQIINKEAKLPDNTYYSNIDLVFKEEKNRIATLDDYSEYRNYKTNIILDISKKFKTNIDEKNQLRFISINKQYPNSELKEFFDMGIWYDDDNFVYSVENKGIYMYNAATRKYTTIIEGEETYKIIKVFENKIYYDETYISVE